MWSVVGGREGDRKRERERELLFTLSSRLHRPLPVFCIRYRICPRPGHRPESVYIYIYIYSLGRRLSPPARMVSGKRKKRKKGSSWKIIIPPLDSGRPRRGLSPLNIEILGLPPFIWMDLSSPLQVSMIFRDLYIESHRGVETPLLFGDPVGASGTDLCILSYFIFEDFYF